MREDPSFGTRLQKKTEAIKVDKQNLLSIADEYSKIHQNEIKEGTELRNRLLTEGESRGLSEKEIMSSYGKFVPTIYTPVLNFLYFMLRESDNDMHYGKSLYAKRDIINEQLIKNNLLEHDDKSITESSEDELLDSIQKLILEQTRHDNKHNDRANINKQIAAEETLPEDEVKLKDSPEMMEYLFGHLTLSQFNTVKKLKALSKSSNENEAFQAYTKCIQLCKEYKIEFDKVPCYVGQK